MTEMDAVGSFCRLPHRSNRPLWRNSIATAPGQGMPLRFVEIRARGDGGLIPGTA